MEIVAESFVEEFEEFFASYEHADGDGGFWFPCAPDGKVFLPLNEFAQANYDDCLAGTNGTRYVGVERTYHTYRNPAVGKCDRCGREVQLGNFTNTCKCGADYNSTGSRLAPRSQWGEETGERWFEVI